MLIVKGSKRAEAGERPSPELMEAMSEYNQALRDAGVHVMAKGLYPSSNGMRFSYRGPGDRPIVTEGPFMQIEELIAGFILIDVASRKEAIDWALRMPDPQGHGEGEIELRQVFD